MPLPATVGIQAENRTFLSIKTEEVALTYIQHHAYDAELAGSCV